MDLTDRLSKSRVQKGLRCPLQLYLSVHNYDLGSQPTPEQQKRFDVGNLVGSLAQDRFPGGILIEEDHFHHREAVQTTLEAMQAGVSAIFEAAFTYDNVKVRVDVLRRLENDGWELIEVKSTGGYDQDKHLSDAGIQLYVLRGCGVDVQQVSLMHLNRNYVYPGGMHDPNEILASTNITQETNQWIVDAPELVAAMMETLALPSAPNPPASVDCEKPYGCEFFEYCSEGAPEHPISELCGRSSRLYAELVAQGVNAVQDVPGELIADLPRAKQLHHRSVLERKLLVEPAILKRLDDLRFPLYFVDFETLMPGLPFFIGTSPYQIVRVQWSVHVLHEDGVLEHHEWLASSADQNPDAEFMRTLLEVLGDDGTFIHYSPYERTQLVDIATRIPEFAQPLVDRISGFLGKLEEKAARLGTRIDVRPSTGGMQDFDLGARVVKDGCFHPDMHSGWSIKGAIKAMAPDLPPYESLAVSNGDAAMNATEEMLASETPEERAVELSEALLEYCRQDTLAMVEIYRTLKALRDTEA